jgi:hypothetical protein
MRKTMANQPTTTILSDLTQDITKFLDQDIKRHDQKEQNATIEKSMRSVLEEFFAAHTSCEIDWCSAASFDGRTCIQKLQSPV